MPRTTIELRVTLELLHPETGEITETETVLCAVNDGELEAGGLGDIEAAIDDMLPQDEDADEDEDADDE